MENDLPIIFNIDFNSVLKLKKLISIIARIVPYNPNVKKLADQIEVTRETLLRYLSYLEKAQVLKWLGKDTHGINYLNKPEKLYLQNTNLIYALTEESGNVGAIRETFVLNQLSVNHSHLDVWIALLIYWILRINDSSGLRSTLVSAFPSFTLSSSIRLLSWSSRE